MFLITLNWNKTKKRKEKKTEKNKTIKVTKRKS